MSTSDQGETAFKTTQHIHRTCVMPMKRHILKNVTGSLQNFSFASFHSGFWIRLSTAFHHHVCPLIQVLGTQLHPYFQTGHYSENVDSCSLKTLCFFEQDFFLLLCCHPRQHLHTQKLDLYGQQELSVPKNDLSYYMKNFGLIFINN